VFEEIETVSTINVLRKSGADVNISSICSLDIDGQIPKMLTGVNKIKLIPDSFFDNINNQ